MSAPPTPDPQRAVNAALAGVRLSGGEPTPEAIELAHRVAAGDMTADDAVAARIRAVLGT